MIPQECCVLIPSLSPDERLPQYVLELMAAQYGLILVVDDGSASNYQEIFERISTWPCCKVLHHPQNRGKGAALRTGFSYIQEHTALKGIVTADSDGQHTVPDTLNLTQELSDKQELLLGSRDFSLKNQQIPTKSRVGNRITSCVFKALYGPWLPDTQTGLRAFPRELIPAMLQVSGDRFEYEMNQLMWCTRLHIPIRPIGIETVYIDENQSTHFHPIRDSYRIYKLLLGNFVKFSCTGLISWLVDYVIRLVLDYWVLNHFVVGTSMLFGLIQWKPAMMLSYVPARFVSSILNYKLNKDFVFHMKECPGALGRYYLLVVAALLISMIASSILSLILPDWLAMVLVDIVVFIMNYRIQKAWVFPQNTQNI